MSQKRIFLAFFFRKMCTILTAVSTGTEFLKTISDNYGDNNLW